MNQEQPATSPGEAADEPSSDTAESPGRDPRDTDHPVGEDQAQANAEDDLPG